MRWLFLFIFSLAAGCAPQVPRVDGGTLPGDVKFVQLVIAPADQTIVYQGSPITTTYTASGVTADGQSTTLSDVTFTLSGMNIGTFSQNTLTVSGELTGTGTVTATAKGLTSSTSVKVFIKLARLGPSVPPDAPSHFSGSAVSTNAPVVVYPLDGVVMPSTVNAPLVQWEGEEAADDLFRVTVVAGDATVEGYVKSESTSTSSWALPQEDWTKLVVNRGSGPVLLTVDRWRANDSIHRSATISLNVVEADVRGVIYYWSLTEGKLLRIDQTGRAPAIAFPPPSPTMSENRCVACHTVSSNGRYLAGALWGGGESGVVFDLKDSKLGTDDPAPTVTPLNSYTTMFSTFNPDASRLMINSATQLSLIDAQTGAAVVSKGTPLPNTGASHPTWSPDGSKVAFISQIDGPSALDYTGGNLSIIPVTGIDTFGPAQLLVDTSGSPDFRAPSWPTFTPDSQWLACGAGTNSRGRNAVDDPQHPGQKIEVVYPGALFITRAQQGSAPVQMSTACAGQRNCYLPNFSPFTSGGYYWMVFYSLRDYGNAKAGTKGALRRQMWVTAIDIAKLGSGDPSSVPYWLPGQDSATENMSAVWAQPPSYQ